MFSIKIHSGKKKKRKGWGLLPWFTPATPSDIMDHEVTWEVKSWGAKQNNRPPGLTAATLLALHCWPLLFFHTRQRKATFISGPVSLGFFFSCCTQPIWKASDGTPLNSLLLLLLSCFSVSDSVWPHRWQPTRLPRPWDSPGKNTRVGCHFLPQCMKVKSESEATQSCLTLSKPMDCSTAGSSVHGIFQARGLEWGAIAFSTSRKIWSVHKNCISDIQWQTTATITAICHQGFAGGSSGKESACNVGDLGSIPGLGRSPREGNGYPLQCSGLENSLDCIVHDVAKSQTQHSDFHFTFTIQEDLQ